jgi:hypothetical protein
MSGLQVVRVPDLTAEQRWPAWVGATTAAGFAAVVAVPAAVDPVTAVALNVYLASRRRWTEQDDSDASARAEAVATDVRERLTAATRLPATSATRVDGNLRSAHLDQVDLAVGVLMQANGCNARSARALLELVAARHGTDVREVASVLLAAMGGLG